MSFGGKPRVPLKLCVALGDRSCLLRVVRSPLSLRGAPLDSSRIATGMNRASSRVEAGTSAISDYNPRVSANWNKRVRPRILLRNGTPLVSGVLHQVTGHLSSCIWNLHLFPENAMGVSFPLVLLLHPQGYIRRGARASGLILSRQGDRCLS